MGNKTTTEELPLLQEHFYELAIYDNTALYYSISGFYDTTDRYGEYGREVKLIRYRDKMIKVIDVRVDNKDYISSRNIPTIVTYRGSKDVVRFPISDNVILLHMTNDSPRLLDLTGTSIEQYVMDRDNVKDIMDIILNKHVLLY